MKRLSRPLRLLVMLVVVMFAGVSFAAETSIAPDANNIVITNNAGVADTVKVSGLRAGDVVKVYNSSKALLLGKGVVLAGKTEAVVSIAQLGIEGGNVFVSVTSIGLFESAKTEKVFSAEAKTPALPKESIIAANNPSNGITGCAKDTVKVVGLKAGDTVKVYLPRINLEPAGPGDVPFATVKVSAGSTQVIASLYFPSYRAGSVYVTLTRPGYLESDMTEAQYSEEVWTPEPVQSSITITNYAGKPDTVRVTGLAAGDLVKVYRDNKAASPVLGTKTVAAAATEATLTISQLGVESGTVYLAVTSVGKNQSIWLQKSYGAEPKSAPPSVDSIIVSNNAGIADTVKVTGVSSGSIVKVYKVETGGIAAATKVVASGASEAIASVTQIGEESGKLYITVTTPGFRESDRTEKTFDAELVSDIPDSGKMLIINNIGTDFVLIYGLAPGDVVKLYDSAASGTMLKSATVAAGQSQVVINVAQLGKAGGTVYVSVANKGQRESSRVSKSFVAE